MMKKNIENLQRTVEHKISAAKSVDELRTINNELVEWVDWLKKDNKISNAECSNLRVLISNKIEEKNKSYERDISPNPSIPYKKKIGMVLLFLAFFTLIIYTIIYIQGIRLPVEESISLRTIPFRGTLKSADGQPIDSKTDVIFRLYNDQNAEQPLYEGKCIGVEGIVPDYRGEFTVVLGSDCNMNPIQESVLKNEILFLGVTIGSGDEIIPRYRILSSAYSHNSAQLSGKIVGTEENNIPYLDSNGTMLIEASEPIIKATSGNFTIEGASLSLKTGSGGEGNILLQPDAGGYTIIPAGNVGLGIFEPSSKLEVVGLEPFNPITAIKNISLEDSENTNVLSLGLGTPINGESAKFISFRADVTKEESGTEVGAIRLNGQGVSYETQGADFAEYFDADSKYSAGIVIALTKNGPQIAHINEPIIGVVSDSAGFVGNSRPRSGNSILIGMVGQVYVYVTNENGNISVGDSIVIGSVPGYGVKGGSKNKVGYALEDMKITDMSESDCPREFNHIKDMSGTTIKCSRVKILLRPN